MRLDTARRHALSLPETTEEPHFERSSFRVRGKIFATVPDTGTLNIKIDPDESAALQQENPAAYQPVWWGQRIVPHWLQVNLAAADRQEVCELLTDAWRGCAPKRVIAAFDAR